MHKRPNPCNEAGLIEGLAKHILGDDADVAEVMKARASTPDELATVLTGDLVEGAADLIDEGDLATAKAKVLGADMAREESKLRRRGGRQTHNGLWLSPRLGGGERSRSSTPSPRPMR